MANNFLLETRDERIERMFRDNPGRPIELCTAVVDGIWDKRRERINSRIPSRFIDASIADLGYFEEPVLSAIDNMLAPPSKKNDKVGIILSGQAGTGKTHTMFAIMRLLAERNPELVAYSTNYTQMMQALRQEFLKDSYDDLSSMWDRVNNDSGMYDGVLFIDDVSASKQSDFEIDKLTMVLDRRMNEYMPFVITTNVLPEDFKDVFGERLASRFHGYCEIILFDESDQRLKKVEPVEILKDPEHE